MRDRRDHQILGRAAALFGVFFSARWVRRWTGQLPGVCGRANRDRPRRREPIEALLACTQRQVATNEARAS
ncbi:TPA: hypothetical protein DCY65_04895 [Candidatus Acetothermia bacterium]|nr:hypothetical protein [Candidatus Acetothermia bacterium]